MEEETIVLFYDELEKLPAGPVTRGGASDHITQAVAKATTLSTSLLKQNMALFMKSLGEILGAAPKEISGLVIDEVEIHALIDQKGNIGINGFIQSETQIEGGIKIILRKKP